MENNSSNVARVLVVDDDEGSREALVEILEDDNRVASVTNGYSAIEKIKQEAFDLVLLDVTMPEIDGIETLKQIKKHDEGIDVIMVSATDRAREATASIKSGAYDYITKPFDADSILAVVERVVQKRRLEREVCFLRSEVTDKIKDHQIISQSKSMQSVFDLIDKVSATASNVLITGESGTGKELVARAIHNESPRTAKPFVAINCAAIPPELIESELFGHEKGAFTGASSRCIGKFEFAHGGTVFLDEISTLKLELQAKLLRFLQELEFNRVGSHQIIKVDVRMIAATNSSLKELVRKEEFREDLLFRLNVIPIDLPPLRQRHGDIPLLINHFLNRFNQHLGGHIQEISPEAIGVLASYHWPGNIRELENVVERLVVLSSNKKRIQEKDLPFELLIKNDAALATENENRGLSEARHAFERRYILRALQISRWNQAKAARRLKIHRNTLTQKIKALGIDIENKT